MTADDKSGEQAARTEGTDTPDYGCFTVRPRQKSPVTDAPEIIKVGEPDGPSQIVAPEPEKAEAETKKDDAK